MPSYRRPGVPQAAQRRRSPLKIILAFLIVLLLLAGIVTGILVLSPDLALLVPGAVGDKAHNLATTARDKLELLISDEGPLGGLRRAAEPYLSKVGLNLPTVLLGLGLLILAILCIRVLAVTSRPDDRGEDFAPGPQAGRGGSGQGGAYWPFQRRQSGLPAASEQPILGGPSPFDQPSQQAFGGSAAGSGFGSQDAPTSGPVFPATATGDAWPLVRQSVPRTPQRESEPGAAPPVARIPGAAPAQPFGESPEAGGGLDFGAPGAPSFSSDFGRSFEPAASSRAFEEPGFGLSSGPPSGVAPSPQAPFSTPESPMAVPPARTAVAPDAADYLADMPTPTYARMPQPQLVEPAPAPGGWPPLESTLPGPGRPQEAWVETRPSMGFGLVRFVLPGLLLLVVGAAGAYGLRTPYARFVTGGPYGTYMLVSAGAVLSMAVAAWFSSGPMKASARRLAGGAAAVAMGEAAAAGEPGLVGGRFSGAPGAMPQLRQVGGQGRPAARSIAPAPIPGRAAIEGGLDAPDAVEWSRLPKPSIFIPGTQSATTVGLDIGTAWIKVAQVGLGRHGLEIVNLGLVPTPEGVLAEGDIADPETLGDVLKDLLGCRNIVQRQVTAALGGQGVIIRHVQFPVMSPDELREVLRWEAEHHIPIPPAEAVVDFTVMPGQGDADETGNRQMRVMLVGAQKRVVEAQVQALRKAKLVPRGIDAEALACYRVVETAGHFVADPLRYAQAVIDLGHSATKLGIYLRGALEMSRTLGVGGRTFTTVLSERLKVPELEAETLKRQYGVHPDGGRVLQALSPTLQDLMFEIRRSFEFFASRHFGQSIRHVYLIGGGARMPGIGSALARYLNPSLGERVPEGAETRVEVIDPLTAVGLSPRLERQANLIGPEFVTALGLALSEEEVASS